MPVKIDKELFYKPYFWAICVPVLLILWAIPVAFGLNSAQNKASKDVKSTLKVEEYRRTVLGVGS